MCDKATIKPNYVIHQAVIYQYRAVFDQLVLLLKTVVFISPMAQSLACLRQSSISSEIKYTTKITVFFLNFYARQQELLQRVLAIAILSVCPSVRLSACPSVTRVDQAKTMQARIIKSSPSAAPRTLVSGSVTLFQKFHRSHPNRGP